MPDLFVSTRWLCWASSRRRFGERSSSVGAVVIGRGAVRVVGVVGRAGVGIGLGVGFGAAPLP